MEVPDVVNSRELVSVLRMLESSKPSEVISGFQSDQDMPFDKPMSMINYSGQQKEGGEPTGIGRLTDKTDGGQATKATSFREIHQKQRLIKTTSQPIRQRELTYSHHTPNYKDDMYVGKNTLPWDTDNVLIKPPHQRGKPRDKKQREPTNYAKERVQLDFIGLIPVRDIPGFESGEILLCIPTGCNHVRIHDSPWDEMGRPVGPKLEFIHPGDFRDKDTPFKVNEASESLQTKFSGMSITPEFSNPETWFSKSYSQVASSGFLVNHGQWSLIGDHQQVKRRAMPSNKPRRFNSMRHVPTYSDAVSGRCTDRQNRDRENQRWGAKTPPIDEKQMHHLGPGYQKLPLHRSSSSPERLESICTTHANNPAIVVSYFQDLHSQ